MGRIKKARKISDTLRAAAIRKMKFLLAFVAAAHAHQLGETVESTLSGKPVFQNASSLLMSQGQMALSKAGIGSAPDATCYCRKTALDCVHVKFTADQIATFINCVTNGAGDYGAMAGGSPGAVGGDSNGQAVENGWCISAVEFNKANGDSKGCSDVTDTTDDCANSVAWDCSGLTLEAQCDTTSCMTLDTSEQTNDGSLNGLTQGYKPHSDTSNSELRFPASCQGQAYADSLDDACGATGDNAVYAAHHVAANPGTALMELSKEVANTFLKKKGDEDPDDDSDAAEETDEENELDKTLVKKPKMSQMGQFIKPEPMVEGDSGYDDEIDAFKQKYGYDDTY